MKIEWSKYGPKSETKISDIPIGTVFTGGIGVYESIFLKALEIVVDLQDPVCSWNTKDFVIVHNYSIRQVKLVIES